LNVSSAALNEIYHPDPLGYSRVLLLINSFLAVGVPLLSLGYACTVASLVFDGRWRERRRPFAAVGRTVICTTIFYNYGPGLYGKVGPLVGLALTIVIYAVLARLSQLWVSRLADGPMEWIWRAATDWQAPRPSATA
jgi:uncharacterized protein